MGSFGKKGVEKGYGCHRSSEAGPFRSEKGPLKRMIPSDLALAHSPIPRAPMTLIGPSDPVREASCSHCTGGQLADEKGPWLTHEALL